MSARSPRVQELQNSSAPSVFNYTPPVKKAFWSSLGVAFTIELALALLFASYLIFREVAPIFTSLPIQIEDVPKTEPVKQEPKKPEPIKPKVEPKPLKSIVTPPPAPTPTPTPQQASPVVETPTAFSAPAPPPVMPVVNNKPLGPSDEFKAKVQAAVQAAFYYPMAAQEMGLTGRTRVSFTLTNTSATDAKIVQSSSIGIIDRAALQAVLKAVFPTPPNELKDKPQGYEIWIEFKPKAN